MGDQELIKFKNLILKQYDESTSDQVAVALRDLITQKSKDLMDGTNPEELVALAELVQSYTAYLKERSLSSEIIQKLVKETINQKFAQLNGHADVENRKTDLTERYSKIIQKQE